MRDFNSWLNTFRGSISDYKYYTDFNNVYRNTDSVKVELHILNSLIGSRNIEQEFKTLLRQYPNVLKAVPILLAKRESEIFCMDKNGSFTYNFARMNLSVDQYCYFMRQTGLFDLMEHHLVANLYDYCLGVNTGLDSNGRKNRGGHLMEDLCEEFIKSTGMIYGKEVYLSEIERKTGLNLSAISGDGNATKRFDFVLYGRITTYVVECNFYASGGSKLNETARSYEKLATEAATIPNFKFVWLTDGAGWRSAKGNLQKTFNVLDTIYNIAELEAGVLNNLR